MPIHLDDLDVSNEVEGLTSVLIVPCNMCPAVTVAVKGEQPFLQPFRHGLRSAPFERHIEALRSRLREQGVRSTVFESNLPHQWFVCMWTSGRRRKLRDKARGHDAVIVLGCDTGTETVRDAVEPVGCRVIEGMEVVGFMNAKMKIRFPCDVTFEDCSIIPIARREAIGRRSTPR